MTSQRTFVELKTVVKTAVIFIPVVGTTFWLRDHPYLSLSLGLCIGVLLSSLIPPKADVRSLVFSVLVAASCGPVYLLFHRFLGW
jgi:hypothetical protein